MRIVGLATIAALAVMSMNAQAKKPVFEKDGFTFSVGGDVEIQYRKRARQGDDAEVEYDDVEVHFFGDYDFSDSFSVFSRVDLDFKAEIDSDDSEDVLDKAIIGFKWSDFSFGFGKYDYVTDDYSPSYDYEMGGNEAFPEDTGEDLIFASAKFGDFALRASTDISEGDDGEAEDEKSFDMLATYDIGDWQIGLAYQDYTASDSVDEETGVISSTDSIDTVGVYAEGRLGNFKTIAGYSENDEGNWIQVAGKYKLNDNWSAALGFETFSADVEGGSDVDVIYSNVTYALNKNVKLFAEVGKEDESLGSDETGWLLGFRVRF